MRRAAQDVTGKAEGGEEPELRNTRYGSGGAYILGEPGEPCREREKRRDRAQILARRAGSGPDWRDKFTMEERAVAVGVKLKEHAHGKEEANMRASKKP